jgi:hypothetical protein
MGTWALSFCKPSWVIQPGGRQISSHPPMLSIYWITSGNFSRPTMVWLAQFFLHSPFSSICLSHHPFSKSPLRSLSRLPWVPCYISTAPFSKAYLTGSLGGYMRRYPDGMKRSVRLWWLVLLLCIIAHFLLYLLFLLHILIPSMVGYGLGVFWMS